MGALYYLQNGFLWSWVCVKLSKTHLSTDGGYSLQQIKPILTESKEAYVTIKTTGFLKTEKAHAEWSLCDD